MLGYGDGLFNVYFPLIQSQSISNVYDIENIGVLGRISFSFDLVKFNPWEIAEDFEF
jgi:hypothetical protein